MKIIDRETIDRVLDKNAVISVVRQAFVDHAQGRIKSPMPMHIEFNPENGDYIGDCHVKAANAAHLPYFAVKLASGFYKNPTLGLPVNNGLVLLLSSTTGQPVALLQDAGLLTSMRTAAAGAIAASLRVRQSDDVLGIVGTGHQAEQQALWISHYLGLNKIMIYGRSATKAELLTKNLNAHGLNVVSVASVSELCKSCEFIITTTPAREPVLLSADISKPIHVVAMGSDVPGKQEVESEILKRAEFIVNDDLEQCRDHGETGCAIRSGLIENNQPTYLGEALDNGLKINRDVISLVDLTGLGAQDLAIANLVAKELDI